MNKWFPVMMLVALLPMTNGGVHAQTLEGRIAFIDLNTVFDNFHKTKIADAQLKEKAEEFNQERRNLLSDFEGLNDRFQAAREQAQDVALSDAARARARNVAEDLLLEIRDFENRIQLFDQQRRQELEEQGRRMRTRIVNEIQEEISRYARTQGISAVIDSSGRSLNDIEMILYVDSRYDITEIIAELLDQKRTR